MGFGDTCVLTKSDEGTHIRGEQGAGSERTSRSLKARHLQNGGSGPDARRPGQQGLRVPCAPGTRRVLGGRVPH